MILLFLALGASAQEPPVLEITVVGEVEIRDARAAVIRAAEAVGWDGVERRGRVVLRPPSSWMGRAELSSDGELTFGRPILALADIEAQSAFDPEQNPNLSTPTGLTTAPGDFRGPSAPTAGARFWFLPAASRFEGARRRLLAAIDDEVVAYNRVIRLARGTAQPAPLPSPPVP